MNTETPHQTCSFPDPRPPGKLGLSGTAWVYLKRSVSLALGVRLAIFAISYLVGRIVLERSGSVYDLMHETLYRWDAISYLSIAQHGYSYTQDTEHLLGFFFFFPLLIKAFSFVLGDVFIAGLAVTFVASVIAGYFLQQLVSLDAKHDGEAGRAVWYFYCAPTAYFLIIPYSESVFLALSVAAFYFARRRRWLVSGLLAALTAATRFNGVLLLPALAAEAFLLEGKAALKKAYGLMLTPLGLLANVLVSRYVSGSYLAYVTMQRKHFSQNTVAPWDHVAGLVRQFVDSSPSSYKTMSDESILIPLLLAVLLLLASVRWMRLSYQIYAWSQLLCLLTASWLISFPRLILVIFPLAMVMARIGRNEERQNALAAACALGMGALAALFATGQWAF
jgi:Gpi18-like mannosyltransferase